MNTGNKTFRIPTSSRRAFDGELVLLASLAAVLAPIAVFAIKVWS